MIKAPTARRVIPQNGRYAALDSCASVADAPAPKLR